MRPLISIIMPVFNSGPYVKDSIQSVIDQSYENFELIIVNDASTDNSKDVIVDFDDKRIRYFENQVNSGPSFCKNLGLSHSNGEYVAFLDSDDICLTERFSVQQGFMQDHPEIKVCGASAEYFGVREGVWKFPETDAAIRVRLLWGSGIIQSTAILRRDILKHNDITFPENLRVAEDFLFWVRLAKVAKFHNIPKVLIKYRTHRNQLTMAKSEEMDSAAVRIIFNQLKEHVDLLTEDDFQTVYKLVTFRYDFTTEELIRLNGIYRSFVNSNERTRVYEPRLLFKEVTERMFEACYFSTRSVGFMSYRIFLRVWGLKSMSLSRQIRFIIKIMFRRNSVSSVH